MIKLPFFGDYFKTDEAESTLEDPDLPTEASKKVVTSLPRGYTFQRQLSERRERLEPNEQDNQARRALSADRRSRSAFGDAQLRSTSSVPSELPGHGGFSLTASSSNKAEAEQTSQILEEAVHFNETFEAGGHFEEGLEYPTELPSDPEKESSDELDELQLQEEADQKWILNLSMHFRDKSDREKFFITYMQEPNKWLRITVSCDYRNCSEGSLEAEIKSLYYQRDKSSKIYGAVRESLPDIRFFTTVTNLKLQTEDGRLHVHVTEDENEIIKYPACSLLPYLVCDTFFESEVFFDSHESGFVHRVTIRGKRYIKKEIPSPEAVEEFLYEVNALNSLRDSAFVIAFEGLVVDESQQNIKGLVLGFAENGALVDILYDLKNTGSLPWSRRVKWARQIVHGLSDIHEAGYVQGDFTLSNIVIDSNDDALIIDINRRGCPVGWEPPEMAEMIEAGQKISIYIGVKTDLFQLGMVLWALANEHDEPERVDRPLTADGWVDIPDWYISAFNLCYSKTPNKRPSAKEVRAMFESAQAADRVI